MPKRNSYTLQAWDWSVKTQIFAPVKLTFHKENFFVCGEKKLQGTKNKTNKKTGSTDFSSALNTIKTIEACPCVAMARFSRLIVNTDTAVTLTVRHYA